METIKRLASKKLLEEINYLVDISHAEDWESKYSVAEAFDEIADRAEDRTTGWICFRAECRRIQIALGEYVEMTQLEIDRTVVSSGTVWAFKMKGKAYRLNHER